MTTGVSMKDSGVPDGLGMMGHPQVGQVIVGEIDWPGYAAEVQGMVTAVFGVAAVRLVILGQNQAP